MVKTSPDDIESQYGGFDDTVWKLSDLTSEAFGEDSTFSRDPVLLSSKIANAVALELTCPSWELLEPRDEAMLVVRVTMRIDNPVETTLEDIFSRMDAILVIAVFLFAWW